MKRPDGLAHPKAVKRAFAGLFAVVGCGSGGAPAAPSSLASQPVTPEREVQVPAPSPSGALSIADVFARAASPRKDGTGGWVVVIERPQSLRDASLDPRREIVWTTAPGSIESRLSAPPGSAILDVAVHDSGQATVLYASASGFRLARHDARGGFVALYVLTDDAIATDPPSIHPEEPTGPIELHTHDVGRVAADGEDVILVTRTARHSVVAHRVGFDRTAARFERRWRTLVVPAHRLYPIGLTGGTYDVFGQLEAHYAVHVARGASGTAYVAVQHARLESGEMVRAHAEVFGEALPTDPDALDIFVTRISAQTGARLGTSVVSTPDDDQLYGLRAVGEDAWVTGRTERWNAEGTGFDALLGRVDPRGAVEVRLVSVERGDVAFDVAPATDGGLVVVGASAYWQNPRGASISEESSSFARWLRADGSEVSLVVANGARHNEARFVVPLAEGRYWVGGMQDGPGTHSADLDVTLLRARAFANVVAP